MLQMTKINELDFDCTNIETKVFRISVWRDCSILIMKKESHI
jgi:hypothetical protein